MPDDAVGSDQLVCDSNAMRGLVEPLAVAAAAGDRPNWQRGLTGAGM